MSLDLHCFLGLFCEGLQASAVLIIFEPHGEVPVCSHGQASLSENAAFPLLWWQDKESHASLS